MITDLYIGVDLGTGSCRCAIVDNKVKLIEFEIGDYKSNNISGKWIEQDPEAIFECFVEVVSRAVAKAKDKYPKRRFQGISIGGALHNIMALSPKSEPLTGVMTWADTRAFPQAEKVKAISKGKSFYNETGCPPHAMYPVFKIGWLGENQLDIYQKASKFISAKEYVVFRLTGELMVDTSVASGSGFLNVHTLDWNPSSLAIAGIGRDKLSTLCTPMTIIPELIPHVANTIGIPATTPLVLGASDAFASSIGSGAVNSWQATCMVGTSGALRVFSEYPWLDKKSRSWCYCIEEGRWLIGGAINNGGLAFAWLRNLVNKYLPNEEFSFDDLMNLAEKVKPGANDLLCLPFFSGERSPNWNEHARAAFYGLTLEHDLSHMSRAIIEAICFRIRSLLDILSDSPIKINQVKASGGFTKSNLWLQIMSDVLNKELIVPAVGETSCLGTTFWVLKNHGVINNYQEFGDLIPNGKIFEPDRKESEVYQDIYQKYLQLYSNVSDLYK